MNLGVVRNRATCEELLQLQITLFEIGNCGKRVLRDIKGLIFLNNLMEKLNLKVKEAEGNVGKIIEFLREAIEVSNNYLNLKRRNVKNRARKFKPLIKYPKRFKFVIKHRNFIKKSQKCVSDNFTSETMRTSEKTAMKQQEDEGGGCENFNFHCNDLILNDTDGEKSRRVLEKSSERQKETIQAVQRGDLSAITLGCEKNSSWKRRRKKIEQGDIEFAVTFPEGSCDEFAACSSWKRRKKKTSDPERQSWTYSEVRNNDIEVGESNVTSGEVKWEWDKRQWGKSWVNSNGDADSGKSGDAVVGSGIMGMPWGGSKVPVNLKRH